MIVEPFFFQDSGNELYGVYHPPNVAISNSIGIVFSHPFGQEYIRSYRTFYLLANNLAKLGYHVLRFDYYGCGESDGDLISADINIWINNLQASINELRACGVEKIVVIGLRLGATICLLGNERIEANKLILWHPLLSGNDYLKRLMSDHKAWIDGSFAKHKDVTHVKFESHGFPISSKLYNQFRDIKINRISDSDYLLLSNEILPGCKPEKFMLSDNVHFWIKDNTNSNSGIIPIKDLTKISKWIQNI